MTHSVFAIIFFLDSANADDKIRATKRKVMLCLVALAAGLRLEMLAVQKKLNEYQNMRIAQLTAQLKEQAPKVEAYNRLIDRSGLVKIRETAKELNVKVKVLVVWLIGHGWCFRGKYGEIVATAEAVRRKLMAIRECESHGKVFQQSLITEKGRAKLALALGGGKFQELGFERG